MSDNQSRNLLVCDTCKAEHEPIEPGMSQAYECAATVTENELSGHYGSVEADMEVYLFSPSRPLWVAEGMICDECIALLKKQGVLVLDEARSL